MASPLDARECGDCGHSFARSEYVRHEAEASMAEVMRVERTAAEIGEWVAVDRVMYARHTKPGKPDSLRVEYQCGLTVIRNGCASSMMDTQEPRRPNGLRSGLN